MTVDERPPQELSADVASCVNFPTDGSWCDSLRCLFVVLVIVFRWIFVQSFAGVVRDVVVVVVADDDDDVVVVVDVVVGDGVVVFCCCCCCVVVVCLYISVPFVDLNSSVKIISYIRLGNRGCSSKM